MKNITTYILTAILAITILAPFVTNAQTASERYQPLAPIAPLEADIKANKTDDSFSDYLNGMFRLGIGIASALAVIMIVFGGIRYMSTDSVTGKKDGLGYVNSAVGGLILIIFSWLILRTLNPALLSSSLPLSDAPQSEGIVVPINEERPLTEGERLEQALQNINAIDAARRETIEELASAYNLNQTDTQLLTSMMGDHDAAQQKIFVSKSSAFALIDNPNVGIAGNRTLPDLDREIGAAVIRGVDQIKDKKTLTENSDLKNLADFLITEINRFANEARGEISARRQERKKEVQERADEIINNPENTIN